MVSIWRTQHDDGINYVHWIGEQNVLVTGSWDGTLRYWDGRQQAPALTVQLGNKLCAADVFFDICCFCFILL